MDDQKPEYIRIRVSMSGQFVSGWISPAKEVNTTVLDEIQNLLNGDIDDITLHLSATQISEKEYESIPEFEGLDNLRREEAS